MKKKKKEKKLCKAMFAHLFERLDDVHDLINDKIKKEKQKVAV